MVIAQLVKTPKALLESPGFLLKRLGHLVKEKTIDAYDGRTPYAYGVLTLLDQGACQTQATIADALGYDRSYLVGVLDELERDGLVERRRDTTDRRRHVVTMTPTGKKELARLRRIHESIDDEFFAALSATEQKTLTALLEKVAASQDPRYSR
ncbi:MAG TPA: MarR family transcriptional regulator [Gaiellaceae bacterium]|nr:MarR family transcriptional regulator [Gaiellaceae bacterium]